MSKVETAALGSGVGQRVDVSLNESISTEPLDDGDADARAADDAGSGGRASSAAADGG